MRRLMWVGSLLLVSVIGCALGQKGIAVVTYDKDRAAVLQTATADGEYALYDTMAGDPIASYLLKEGDALGFKSSKTSEIIAVAGDKEIPLKSDKGYVWKRRVGGGM